MHNEDSLFLEYDVTCLDDWFPTFHTTVVSSSPGSRPQTQQQQHDNPENLNFQ